MTSPEQKILPDTEVSPATVARIAEIFDQQGLQYHTEEHQHEDGSTVEVFRSGFANTAIAMQVREDTLIIDSIWRGQVPVSEGPTILTHINQWNAEHFAPTLRFYEGGADEKALVVSAVRELTVSEGVSRNQLGAFVMSSLNSILDAWTFIESQYPQLVTWEEHQHD